MKRNKLLKPLLIALCMLLGGVNYAWAEDTLYERGGSGTAWSNDDLTDWVPNQADYGTVTKTDNSGSIDRVTRTASSEGLYFSSFGYKNQTGTTEYPTTSPVACYFTKTLTGSELPAENTLLTWTATWKPGSATGSSGKTNSFIQFGDVKFQFYGSDNKTKVTIGSVSTDLSTAGKTRNGTYQITVTINLRTKSVSYVFHESDTKEDNGSGTTSLGYDGFTSVSYGLNGQMPSSWGLDGSIVNVKITSVDAPLSAHFTVCFKDESGTELKTSVTRIGDVGGYPNLLATDEASFYDNNETKAHKYVYKEDDFADATINSDGSSEYTITYKTYEPYTYVVKQKLGTADATTIATETLDGDAEKIVYWPKCVKSGDYYYVIDANNAEPKYGVLISSSNKEYTINYTIDESIVYYAEYESVYGGVASYNYFTDKSSGGKSKALSGNNTMTTNMNLTEVGVYRVVIAGGNRDSGHNTTLTLKLKDSNGVLSDDNVINESIGGGVWKGEMTATVCLPVGSELYVANDNGTGTSKFVGDYVIIRKTFYVGAATPSITNGAYIPNTLSTMTFTFSDAYTSEEATFAVLNNATAKLYASDGETLITTGTLSVSGKVVTADFGNNALTAGTDYVITLPAGAVGYEGQLSNSAVSVTVHTGAVAEGDYYLKNKATGAYFAAGQQWNTQAITDNIGHVVSLEVQPDGKYHIDTHISGASHYLTQYLWVDNTADDFALADAGDDYYTISFGDNKLTAGDSGELLTLTSGTGDNTKWKIITVSEWKAEQVARLSAATAASGVDATFYIPGANFNRNDDLNSSWNGSPVINGLDGNNVVSNYNAEKFNATPFDVYQNLTGLKAGAYKLTADGFYRNGTTDDRNAILYAGSAEVPLANIHASGVTSADTDKGLTTNNGGFYVPNTQAEAAKAFNNGYYDNELYFIVSDTGAGTGDVTIGVKKTTGATNDWACFDNFQLTYYGDPIHANVSQPATGGTITIQVADAAAVDATAVAFAGQTITLANTPAAGYTLASYSVTKTAGGDAVDMATENTFVMPAEDVTVTATFEKIKYALTSTAANGTVTMKYDGAEGAEIASGTEIEWGTTVYVESENENLDDYYFTSLKYGDTDIASGETFVMPQAAVEVAAVYTARTDIATAVVALDETSYVYDIAEHEPTVTGVTFGEIALTPTTDYTITVVPQTNAGNYTAIVTGQGIYKGTASADWTINQRPMYDVDIAHIAPVTLPYGENARPEVIVTLNGITVEPEDYTKTWGNADRVGEASVTISSTGRNFTSATNEVKSFTIKRQINVTLNGSNQKWATYYAAENLAKPADVKVYRFKYVDRAVVVAEEVSYIKKETPLLLYSESAVDAAALAVSEGTGTDYETGDEASSYVYGTLNSGNMLHGNLFYVLYNGQFVRAEGNSIAANRCYLAFTVQHVAPASGAPELDIVIAGEESTGMSEVETKIGERFAAETWYTLDGRKLQGKPTKKGMYIMNGKKTVIR